MRYIFSSPVTGATEWSQMLLIISMLAMGIAVADGRAIRVGIIVDRFPRRMNIAFELIMGILALLFFALVGYALVDRIGWEIEKKKAYFYVGWPEWPMYLSLGIAFLTSALGTIYFVIKSILNVKTAKEKELTDDPELAALLLTYEHDNQGDKNNVIEDFNRKEVSE
jgi:TRAP-type C4-dicarboxylate transport system permease small subunit